MKRLQQNMGRILLSVVMTIVAVLLGIHMWDYYMNAPWTRDGKIRADVASIAPDVPGFVDKIYAHDNQVVKKGDMLFSIDRVRYDLAVRREQANVEQAAANLEMADKDLYRYQHLDDTAVTEQKREQVVAARAQAKATYHQARADLDLAKLNLERTIVRASVDGILTNFSLRPGTYVDSGVAVAALVDTSSYYVAGYFEENKLERVKIGDRVKINLLGSDAVLYGRVQGIAAGIRDRERDDDPGTLANVSPTFNWVRLAQRVPVRIQIEEVPEGVRIVSGRTVSVAVIEGESTP